MYLRSSGIAAAIQERVENGTPLIGICGGYQMLGKEIRDPHHTESENDGAEGLGLLHMTTTFSVKKLTSQVEAECHDWNFLGEKISATGLRGYEIHMGKTEFSGGGDTHPLKITKRADASVDIVEGTCRGDGLVFGTYIHGIFDHDEFRRAVLNAIRKKKGLEPRKNTRNVRAEKERSYDALADVVRKHLDMEKVREIMGMDGNR